MAENLTRVNLEEFQEGAWADLKTVVPWGLSKKAMAASLASDGAASGADRLAAAELLICGLVADLNLKDIDGNDVVAPVGVEALAAVDTRVVTALSEAVNKITGAMSKSAGGVPSTTDSSSES